MSIRSAFAISLAVTFILSVVSGIDVNASPNVFAIDVYHGGDYPSIAADRVSSPFYDFVSFIENKGWDVIYLNVNNLTYEYLVQNQIKVLCIQFVRRPYSSSELSAINKFVYNGGGLFIQADSPKAEGTPYYAKEVTKLFGITITETPISESMTVIPQAIHPQWLNGVQTFYLKAINKKSSADSAMQLRIITPPAYTGLRLDGADYLAGAMIGGTPGGGVIVYPHDFQQTLSHADNSVFLAEALKHFERITNTPTVSTPKPSAPSTTPSVSSDRKAGRSLEEAKAEARRIDALPQEERTAYTIYLIILFILVEIYCWVALGKLCS